MDSHHGIHLCCYSLYNLHTFTHMVYTHHTPMGDQSLNLYYTSLARDQY